MPGHLSDSGVLRGRGTLTARGAISQSGILARPDVEWTPLDANPILLLDPALGTLKTGGTPAGYLDPIATWQNQGTGASDATQSTESHQPTYMPHDGSNYLHLPGIIANNAKLTQSVLLNAFECQITIKMRRANWQDPLTLILLACWAPSNGKRSWNITMAADGIISMLVSSDGTNTSETVVTKSSTASVPFSNGEWGWIRITCETQVLFETSDDGVNWAQLGELVSGFSINSYTGSSSPFCIGEYTDGWGGNIANASIAYVKIANGSTVVREIDFSNVPHGATSFVCATGQTVTIHSTGFNPASVIGSSILRFDGSNDNLTGTFSETLTKGRFFVVGRFRSIVGGGRIFATAAEEGTDEDEKGAVWFYQAGAEQPGVYFADGYKMARGSGYSGRYIWETYLNGTSNLTRFGGTQLTSSDSTETLASTRYAIAQAIGEDPLNGAADIEYLALFPATMSDLDVHRMRAYLTKRFGLPA
jgi:hypothetical protein